MISDTHGKRESHFVTPQLGCETGAASTKDASDPNSFTNRCVNSTLNGGNYRGRNVYMMVCDYSCKAILIYNFTIQIFLMSQIVFPN